MQERQVTIEGESFPLPPPFMALATQNPIEMEGTYPLPEAQLDRFLLKVRHRLPERGRGGRAGRAGDGGAAGRPARRVAGRRGGVAGGRAGGAAHGGRADAGPADRRVRGGDRAGHPRLEGPADGRRAARRDRPGARGAGAGAALGARLRHSGRRQGVVGAGAGASGDSGAGVGRSRGIGRSRWCGRSWSGWRRLGSERGMVERDGARSGQEWEGPRRRRRPLPGARRPLVEGGGWGAWARSAPHRRWPLSRRLGRALLDHPGEWTPPPALHGSLTATGWGGERKSWSAARRWRMVASL
jgi:hypothetical protein